MRKPKPSRTRYLKPRRVALPEETEFTPLPQEWHEEPINGPGQEEGQ